jgi:hypothetical protein
MNRKAFRTKLFKRTVNPDNSDYWQLLYAEVLYRLKELEDLKCPCSFCFKDRVYLKNSLDRMVNEGYIPENKKPDNFTGKGDCGRRMGPAA